MKTRFSNTFSSAALVASLALASAFAAAQPMSPGGHGEHGGKAHAMRGGHGGGEAHFAKRLEAMKAKLNLNATQEAQFNVARDATKAAIETGRAARMSARETAKAELSKADPDLAGLLVQRESLKDANAPQRKAAMNEWAKFLSLLNTEQKSLVKSQLIARMNRAPGV
jgi:Spy/CpxP family protein refolding chaperone